jgi:hypothetical protein
MSVCYVSILIPFRALASAFQLLAEDSLCTLEFGGKRKGR